MSSKTESERKIDEVKIEVKEEKPATESKEAKTEEIAPEPVICICPPAPGPVTEEVAPEPVVCICPPASEPTVEEVPPEICICPEPPALELVPEPVICICPPFPGPINNEKIEPTIKVDMPKQPELAKHDSSVLDLAFIMDCTGSMGSYIHSATESIREIVEEIVALEKSDIKLALVEYRDHPPQESTFVTRTHDFTESVKEMKKWLEGCSAEGGGDLPEAVADGLHEALKLSWREKSTKICVLISDAPPHGLDPNCDSSFADGCPEGIDPLDVVRKMAEKGITLYSVGCEPALTPYKEFFSAIAFTTGGQYVPLRNAKLLAKVIVGGAAEEISLEKLMEDAEKEVEEKIKSGIMDEKELAEAVQTKLNMMGATTRQIMLNDSNLERASESAVRYSKFSSMAELRKEYKVENSGSGMMHLESSALFGAPMRMYACAMPRVMKLERIELEGESGEIMEKAEMVEKAGMESELSELASPMIMADLPPTVDSEAYSMSSAFSEPATDSYSIVNDKINIQQSERMVQKILNRNKNKFT